MIKEHDHHTKTKATPRKLIYADSKREAPDGSMKKVRRVSPKAKNRHTPKGQGDWRTEAKLRKEPEGRNPKPKEGSLHIKKQVRTPSMRKAQKTLVKILTYLTKYLNLLLSSQESLVSNTIGGLSSLVTSGQTLGGAARNWLDDLDPKSVNSFEELSQKFLEEFSQQKRFAKDPTEIHGIKRRQNEGLQTFMDRFKSESSHIKGVPPVLHISAFMHGHVHPELAKNLNDKIPKTVDECSKGSELSFKEKWLRVRQK
ncbi:reverse transcriptase domain-containing protein [Tanacetum coccineum]